MVRTLEAVVMVAVVMSACGRTSDTEPDEKGPDASVDTVLADASADASPTDAAVMYTLTVVPAGDGTGSVESTPAGIACGADCTAELAAGSKVRLTATAAGDSVFVGWSGGGCTGTDTCEVTLAADVSIQAMFAAERSIVVALDGPGGTVSSAPAGIDCPTDCAEAYAPGQSVILTATPAMYSVFAGWTGGTASILGRVR